MSMRILLLATCVGLAAALYQEHDESEDIEKKLALFGADTLPKRVS